MRPGKIFFLAISVFTEIILNAQPVKINRLQCEHLVNPLGIDALQPRLSWMMDDIRIAAIQTAYEVLVGTDSVA
ncbi:MAG: hypothetical protein JSS70_19585, partial [Bacteroidetes bacterium]|nr:hypothetical protein [Bacteroidota bacterium]